MKTVVSYNIENDRSHFGGLSMKDMPTKERILYAALDLISEKGYDGVGVDLIAENAGLKGPSLYRHYKGKEDIFLSTAFSCITPIKYIPEYKKPVGRH